MTFFGPSNFPPTWSFRNSHGLLLNFATVLQLMPFQYLLRNFQAHPFLPLHWANSRANGDKMDGLSRVPNDTWTIKGCRYHTSNVNFIVFTSRSPAPHHGLNWFSTITHPCIRRLYAIVLYYWYGFNMIASDLLMYNGTKYQGKWELDTSMLLPPKQSICRAMFQGRQYKNLSVGAGDAH